MRQTNITSGIDFFCCLYYCVPIHDGAKTGGYELRKGSREMTGKNKTRSFKYRIALLSVAALMILAARGYLLMRTSSGVPPEKLTLAYSTPPYTVLIDIAENRGYFLQEGLEVTPQVYAYGKLAFDALLEGKADIATVGETPFVLAVMKGNKLSVLATIQTSHKNNAIIARKDKGILAPPDLKGRKIGTTFGTIGEFFMDAFLVSHGISRKSMKVVNLAPEAMENALTNGDVDAVSSWSPDVVPLLKELGDKGTAFYDADIYTQTFSVVANQEYISKNAGRVNRLIRALVQAEEFAHQNPVEAQKIIAARSGTDVASIGSMWDDNTFSVTLDQSLLLAMEDESRWAIKNRLVSQTRVPNYLDFIYRDGLESVNPKAVRILR